MYTSPDAIRDAFSQITTRMLSDMEPRCTGMWGAFAINWPAASNSAQEKSKRSLIFTE